MCKSLTFTISGTLSDRIDVKKLILDAVFYAECEIKRLLTRENNKKNQIIDND